MITTKRVKALVGESVKLPLRTGDARSTVLRTLPFMPYCFMPYCSTKIKEVEAELNSAVSNSPLLLAGPLPNGR